MAMECGVCFELFENEGTTKCPKLLPCSHTFCVSCLTQLEEDGAIKCPNCRAVHLIPNGAVEKFPTDQFETSLNNNNNKIYILPSSVESAQTGDNGSAICEKHGKPLITFSYLEVHGAQQMFCESCLGSGRYVVSLSGKKDDIVGGPIPGQNNSGREEINNDVRNVNSEVVLLPGCLATEQLTFLQNRNETNDMNYFKLFMKYFVLVICFPFWFSFLLTMSFVAVVTGFITALCYRIYVAVPHCGCPDDIMHFVEPLLQAFFDKIASFIGIAFCFSCMDSDNSIISSMCRNMSKLVIVAVKILDFLLSPVLYLIFIMCMLVVAKVAITVRSLVEFVSYVVLCGERYQTTRRV